MPNLHSFTPTVQYYLDTVYGCTSEQAKWSAAAVEYPCGLLVTPEFLFTVTGASGQALGLAHKRHHNLGHDVSSYYFTEQIDMNEEEASVTVTVTCGCPGKEE